VLRHRTTINRRHRYLTLRRPIWNKHALLAEAGNPVAAVNPAWLLTAGRFDLLAKVPAPLRINPIATLEKNSD
jgi:hypothetical protein